MKRLVLLTEDGKKHYANELWKPNEENENEIVISWTEEDWVVKFQLE